MRLSRLRERFAITRFPAYVATPEWLAASSLVSLTRTSDELSIVCDESQVPPGQEDCERGWNCFKLHGPIAFTVTGVVAELTRPLANSRISVFVISTYDTDYILVKAEQADRAANAWRGLGHEVD